MSRIYTLYLKPKLAGILTGKERKVAPLSAQIPGKMMSDVAAPLPPEALEIVRTDPVKRYRLYPSVRLLMMFLGALNCAIIAGSYGAFNFALVCMVNTTAANMLDGILPNQTFEEDEGLPSIEEEGYDGEFVWSRTVQSSLLAAYAWGGMVLGLPSGALSDKHGCKVIFAVCMVISLLTNAVTPWSAYQGSSWLFAVRFIHGVASGISWPCIVALVARWTTAADTGTFMAMAALGYQFGPLIAMLTSGNICGSSLRWPFIFYMWSGLSAIMLVIWLVLYTDTPSRCRFISNDELEYVTHLNMRTLQHKREKLRLRQLRWTQLMFAPSVLSLYICDFTLCWTVYYMQMFLPVYAKEMLRLELHINALTSTLLQVSTVVSRIIVGPLCDKLTFGGRSVTFSVKFFNSLCFGVPCLGFLSLAVFTNSGGVVVIITYCCIALFIATSVAGFARASVLVGPSVSGLITAVANTYGSLGGVVMPYVVGALLTHEPHWGWRVSNFLTAALAGATVIIYLLFGTAEELKWSRARASDAVSPASLPESVKKPADDLEDPVFSVDQPTLKTYL